ncbi:ABC transporter ATP-binding protein [Psychromonas sp. psych-6C06]|uniref:ABC transporter ATP-binding protein n=1 Tax=Psychromonas sp. psych-6C06 TaxID=2058089 RepID=UPI000C33941C|nr:ABC transporter ATP-binding protein [Psychromonas sp. psych-6C06]PKF62674.1 ABC transporter ATP-binding protein [Psychromonas sp. psych-6C06]
MSKVADKPLIKLCNSSKVFYTQELETHALSTINLQILEGEFVSIAGPSGCGKSTLLSIMGLLDDCTEGEFFLKGQSVNTLSASEKAKLRNKEMGFVFQSFNLISDLTVEENVALPLTYRKEFSAREIKEKVYEALSKVNMGNRVFHYPSQLSGGQQQRVAVARAIVGSPSIIFADEPTGNLDSKNAQAVMSLFKSLHEQGATICMVTHDTANAHLAQRVIELFDGKLVDDAKLQTKKA